jgi:diadenosine tetraphosphate (Ap4A) HIT family hydrolase
MADQCHICERLASNEGVVYASKKFAALAMPTQPGWVLYATKRHGDWIWDLDETEAEELGPFLRRVAAGLKEVTGTTHIYYMGLGENSLHFHGILASRYEPFAKDIQAALAQRGKEIADQPEAEKIASALQWRLQENLDVDSKGVEKSQ